MIKYTLAIIGLSLLSIGFLDSAISQLNISNNTNQTVGQISSSKNVTLLGDSNMSNIITPTGNMNTYR